MSPGSLELRDSAARWAVLAAVFVLAAAVRLSHLEEVQVYSDSLSPLLAAASAWNTGWSDPPNPEADHWLWITALPALLLSDDLRSFFTLRMVTGALAAPLCAAAAMVACDRRPILAGGLAGTAIALDKGLVDSLVSSFRGYMAPEWTALSFLLAVLALRGRNWCLPLAAGSAAIAAGHHPMAYGAVLLLLPAAVRLWRSQGWRPVIVALAVFFLCSSFRLLWIAELLQCDSGGLECITGVALGSSETMAVTDILVRMLSDRFLTETGPGAAALLAGAVMARRSPFFSSALLGFAGLVLLGITISTLRPYHLRILSAPLAAIAAAGLASRPRFGLPLGVLWCASLWFWTPDVLGSRGELELHDRVGRELVSQPRGWIELAWREGEPPFSVAGCALSSWLQGREEQLFPSEPQGLLLLLGSEPTGDPVLSDGNGWLIQNGGALPRASERTVALSSEGWQIGGAYDWARSFHPEDTIILEW